MAYTDRNFKTKKEFKQAVANGESISIYSPGPFGCTLDGKEFIEGPHYPAAHTWYAQVEVKNGIVVKVK